MLPNCIEPSIYIRQFREMSAIVAKPWRDNEGIKGKRKVRDMKTIARCIDMRGAIASRVAAVALSALLAFALLGISLFADLAGATEAKAAEVPVAASTQPIEGGGETFYTSYSRRYFSDKGIY